MVIPCGAAAAAQVAGTAGSASATALGLGMGKTDLELSRDLFKQQMRQAKRLWTADWAEASVRHGEQCMQSAQQHSEAQAMATASYFQAEKLASQGIKLARDQDSRAYEMAWRAEVRESLRDELGNQNNRFNIVMLCDTVCLGCVFTLVADGSQPEETPLKFLHAYVFCLGLSIMLFSVSLWGSVIVVRRLHDNTAARLERKLFAQSEDLQAIWQNQLAQNVPTGPQEMYLVNQAYEKWVAEYLDPIGRASIHMMSVGVVMMFVTAGLLVHNQYLIEYSTPLSVPLIFWSAVVITSTTVLFMKYNEDRKEKKKLGVYDVSWQDESTDATGPFAKITKAADELASSTGLASVERMESFGRRERMERDYCVKTQSLHNRVESLRKESENRTRTRKDVLKLLTTAAEELDALPEELTSRLNKLLHSIDEADKRTAELVTIHSKSADETMLQHEASHKDWTRFPRLKRSLRRKPMALYPIDAQRIPAALGLIRKKLGEISITTLLRLKNTSDEPLRLKSGVQLKEGRYIKSLHANDPHDNAVCYHLYPGTEIPPRTELLIAARSGGGWVPTSGIEGAIVYTNRDESWNFKITFRNALMGNVRRCRVEAYQTSSGRDDDDVDDDSSGALLNKNDKDEQYWQISKDEIDRKANNEVVITVDMLRGDEAAKASFHHRQSLLTLKSGFLYKNRTFGLGLQWQQRWFVLTPNEIIYSQDPSSKKHGMIALKDITNVRQGSDLVRLNVFEIHTSIEGKGPYRLSAASPEDRDSWMQTILKATGIHVTTDPSSEEEESFASSSAASPVINNSIEIVHSDRGTDVLPI